MMRRTIVSCATIVAATLVGCDVPRTRLQQARRHLDHGRLVPALVMLDSVAPAEPEYVEARALAAAVERRIRASQDLVSRGMALRAEWRDEEAVGVFEHALEVWPRQPGAERLIEATRARLAHVRDPGPTAARPGGDVVLTTVVPTVEPVVSGAGGADLSTDIAAPPDVAVAPDVGRVGTSEPPVAAPDVIVAAPPEQRESAPLSTTLSTPLPTGPASATELTAGLDEVRRMLASGAFDDAIRALRDLRGPGSEAAAIDRLFVAVVHQRALLLYGKGEVAAAIRLWEQLLAVSPEHAVAGDFIRAARAEVSDPAAAAGPAR